MQPWQQRNTLMGWSTKNFFHETFSRDEQSNIYEGHKGGEKF